MEFSEVPKGSGLPKLPIPAQAPESMAGRFVLSAVLYRIQSRRTGFISQREIQEMLNRAGRSPVQNHLHTLRLNQFLSRKIGRKSLTQADEYRPGEVLQHEHLAEWQELTKKLFGEAGICKELLGLPAFGTGFLGTTGMLVIGTLRNSKRPLTVAEFHRYLRFFISDEGTVRSRLKKSLEHGLVEKDGPHWSLAPKFDNRLKRYEKDFGAASRKERVKAQHEGERQTNNRRLLGCAITTSQENKMRENGKCIRCGKTNAKCQKAESADLTLEHFPPRAWQKYWGIPDHPHFHFLICPSGNSKYGGHLTGLKAKELDKFIRVSVRSKSDIENIVQATITVEIRKFYRHLESGNRNEAKKAAGKAASLWRGLIHDTRHSLTTTLDGIPLDVSGRKKAKQLKRESKGQKLRSRKSFEN
jgi:hypothetical protein